MPGFAGFDRSEFPGRAEMGWLRQNTNMTWCGSYLGPAPSHDGTSWMGNRAALAGQGWGIAPVYVGQQVTGPGSHNSSLATGQADGDDAARLMSGEGFAAGSAVYLDLENGKPFVSAQQDYVAAWVDAVKMAGFQPGVYCSHTFADQVHALRSSARIWAFNVPTTQAHPVPGANFPDPHPAGSGYTGAFMWQLGQACQITLPGAPLSKLQVDLDFAVVPDPGA